MRDLRLNGIKVSASFITQRSHRAAYCDLLLTVTPENQKEALAEFRRAGELGPYRGLCISGIGDLGFLQEFPLLLYLEVLSQKRVNTRYLDSLENLRGLRLHSPGAGIDFACFPNLEGFIGDWHAENRNLDKSHELRRLRIWKFNPRSQNLATIANIARLEDLELTQTSIASLSGLETLEDLRYFEIAYSPKLKSLSTLASCATGLRELSIEKAKNIKTYDPLGSVSRLRRLKLSSCAPMKSLKWIEGLQHLDFFSFVNTNVLDGNLSHLLKLPKLRYVGTMDKRHYNYKCDDLNAHINQ